MRTTHTYAIMNISPLAYQEIKTRLIEAGYESAVHNQREDPAECVDMHGIAIAPNPGEAVYERLTAPGIREAVGSVAELKMVVRMIETYAPGLFPANELGQIHFGRAMLESAAAEIRAFLARGPVLVIDDPHNPHEAMTKQEREELWEWYKKSFVPRKANQQAGAPEDLRPDPNCPPGPG